jgi:hypothetical protein
VSLGTVGAARMESRRIPVEMRDFVLFDPSGVLGRIAERTP